MSGNKSVGNVYSYASQQMRVIHNRLKDCYIHNFITKTRGIL